MRILLPLLLLAATTHAWYVVPGVALKEYVPGQNIPMLVNVMTAVSTHLPFDYYSLPHCKPRKPAPNEKENLGEILLGDRIKPAPYEDIQMNVDFKCKVVCTQTIDYKDQRRFDELINEEYVLSLILDSLPVSVHNPEHDTYSMGFPLGVKEGKKTYINNHLAFTLKYNKYGANETSGRRVIAFHVKPYSIKHTVDADGKVTSCNDQFSVGSQLSQPAMNDDRSPMQLTFSYSVEWVETTETWASRWTIFLNLQDSEIHWFSIVNSVMIAFFLSGILGAIMLRTLLRDIARYNAIIEPSAPDVEETGWKLVHGDVFRAPERKGLLACYVGTGVQLLGMSFTVLILACLGFVSHDNRGTLFTAILLCFVFLGLYGGYTSARLMKMWGETSWWTAFQTATVVPGTVFVTFFILNLFVWSQQSSAAVPFGAMLSVIAIWFCISLPQVVLGAILGYKKNTIELPCKTKQLVRKIPEQSWYLQPWFTIMCGGVLPFGAVFIELFFILTSIWLNRSYYVFGFLLLVFIILTITCAEITIVMCYFQLCAENYHWWWRSFFTSGSSGLYVFLYSIFYFFTSALKMKKFVPILLFFGYMAVISYIFFVLTGTIGFMACFWFVRKIYGSIKVD